MPTFAELSSAALAAKEPYGQTVSAALTAKGNAGEFASAQTPANGGFVASAALAAKTPSYAEYDSANLGTEANPLAGLSPSVLIAWYDPGDASTVTLSGGNIIGLADKSGNGRHLTTTAGALPLGTIGGRNCLSFDGTQRMDSAAFLHPDIYQIIAVLSAGSLAAGTAMAISADNAAGIRHAQYLRRSTDLPQSVAYSSVGASATADGGAFVLNTPAVISAVRGAASVRVRKNEVAGTAASIAAGSARTIELSLGAQSAVDTPTWIGSIGEIALIANTDVPIRQQVSANFTTKWGVS